LISKDEYLNRIVCEYWYGLTSRKVCKWTVLKKQVWLSGMRTGWNVINPENEISKRELVMKATVWTREEAEKWYADYISENEEAGAGIENRFEILDL
jgi:hypothetical protein